MKTPTQNRRTHVLRVGNSYVGPIDPQTLENPLVPSPAQAMKLDWRDNEQLKAAFFSRVLGCPVVAEEVCALTSS